MNWLGIGAILGITLMTLTGVTMGHENAHRQDCLYRGGNVTSYSFWPWDGHVTCSGAKSSSNFDSFNEAVEYQISPIFLGISVMAVLIMMELGDLRDELREKIEWVKFREFK